MSENKTTLLAERRAARARVPERPRHEKPAYGQRRGSNWTGAPTAGELTTINDKTRKGFTEHEMLDNTELVHMNGRVYDPLIGRFASSDPNYDCGLQTQGWNRYAYVGNKALSFKDSTGFDLEQITVTASRWRPLSWVSMQTSWAYTEINLEAIFDQIDMSSLTGQLEMRISPKPVH